MWKLIYSDYETDKVTRVKGNILSLKDTISDYMIPDKTKFTIVGLYADNKKYSVVATNERFTFAVKPYSTHKGNDKFWVTLIDPKHNFIREYTTTLDIDMDNVKTILENTLNSFVTIDDSLVDYIDNNFSDCERFPVAEIDRVWFEQMRGESILK